MFKYVFTGFEHCSPFKSRKNHSQSDPIAAKAHAGFDNPDTCSLSGQLDDTYHPLFRCPKLQNLQIHLDFQDLCAQLGQTSLMARSPPVIVPAKTILVSAADLPGHQSPALKTCTFVRI